MAVGSHDLTTCWQPQGQAAASLLTGAFQWLGAAAAAPSLWILEGGKPSFSGCPQGWGTGSLQRGADDQKLRLRLLR